MSKNQLVVRTTLLVALLLIAAITRANEGVTPYGDQQLLLFYSFNSQAGNNARLLNAAPSSRDDRIEETVTGDVNLLRIPLVGDIENFGFRLASADGGKFDGMTQEALFVDFRLPWEWSPWADASATPKLVLEAGRFRQKSENRLFASLGPTLRLANIKWRFPLFLDLGLSPTVIDGSTYGDRDFGTSFNFTSHVGLGLRFGQSRNHVVKLRYQHISNGSIDEVNPGVNMIGVDIVMWAR